jgi:hypothetical protein
MQMHANAEPTFGSYREFFRANRLPYQLLADGVGLQYTPHQELLEHRYLELPGGGCCLPVAYVLGHAYTEQGRIKEWIGKLHARMADKSLAGDQRVGWLLARAHAEELREAIPQGRRRELAVRPLYLAGRGWLETACLEAQSEPLRLRAYQELITQLALQDATRAQARNMLARAAERNPASRPTIAAWEVEIGKIETLAQQSRQTQEEQAQEAYVQSLRRRHKRATEQGDRQAVGRYERLLRESGVQL